MKKSAKFSLLLKDRITLLKMSQRNYSSLRPVTDKQLVSLKVSKKTARFISLPCRWRYFKERSVGLLLFWSFSAFALGNYALRKFILNDDGSSGKLRSSLTVLGVVVFFLGSWFVADVYIGRYRVIKASLLTMLSGTVLYSLSLSLKPVFEGVAHTVIDQVIVLIMSLGLGSFQANIVQFSMDQLRDSSTTEITSYMALYMWTFFFGEVISTFGLSCVCGKYEAIASLLFPILLSLAVSSDFLFNHWLVKEQVSYNPLKQIFKVLCYAARNKYPSNRSAYSYWDNENNSRLDLAADIYGGPFSKEQVEDVKKFFQILVVLFVTCLLMGMLFIDSIVYHISVPLNFQEILANASCSSGEAYHTQCFRKFVQDIGYAAVVIFVPMWEGLLFPLFWKCLMRLKMLTRHTLAMGILSAYIVSLVIIEGIGEHNWRSLNPNGTHSCPISSDAHDRYFGVSYGWLTIPSILLNFGVLIISIAGLQFVFAQFPYSMKGIAMNAIYLMLGMAVLAFYGFQMLFHLSVFNGLGDMGCVFWCLLACGAVALLLIFLFLLACSRYQNRQRDDGRTLQ